MSDTNADASAQLTSRSALVEWLRTSAPADPFEVARITLKSLATIAHTEGLGVSMSPDRIAWDLLRALWIPRFPDRRSELYESDGFEKGFEAAGEEIATARAEEEERRQVRIAKQTAERERQEAIRRAAEAERKLKAEAVNKIAKALNCSTRYARMLYTEGTRLKARAEQLARIVGGSPSHYLRDRIKPGPKANLAGYFMRANADGCSFANFAKEAADIPEELQDALYKLCGETDNYFSMDQLIAAARKRGVDLALATDLWLHFMLWRIEELSERALHQAREQFGGDVPRADRRIIVRVVED